MDLKKWNIFALLNDDFIMEVKIACVFGESVKNSFLQHILYLVD